MKIIVLILLSLLPFAILASEDKPYLSTRVLSTDAAIDVAVATEKYCRKKGYQVAVAVVDRYGNLLAFSRNPLAGAHTIKLAINKAFTASTLQTRTLGQERQMAALATEGLSVVGGGVPIQVGGYIYGSVGVSGAPQKKRLGDIDDECAHAGMKNTLEALEFAN